MVRMRYDAPRPMTRRSITIRRPSSEDTLPLSELKHRRVRVVLRPADTTGRRGESVAGVLCTFATIYGWIWSAVALAGAMLMAGGIVPPGPLPPALPVIGLFVGVEWLLLIGVTVRRAPFDRSVFSALFSGAIATLLIWLSAIFLGGFASFAAFAWTVVLGGGAVCLPAAPAYDAWLRRKERLGSGRVTTT